MTRSGNRALHWLPDEDRWEEIDWDAFLAFRESMVPFAPLPGVNGGIHHFVVCVCDDKKTYNIIGHKYLVEPGGKVGRDNFFGWNKEDREDYERLVVATKEEPGDRERLNEIRDKAGNAMYPPKASLYPLVRAVPLPPEKGSAAIDFFDAVAAGVSRAELSRRSD